MKFTKLESGITRIESEDWFAYIDHERCSVAQKDMRDTLIVERASVTDLIRILEAANYEMIRAHHGQ